MIKFPERPERKITARDLLPPLPKPRANPELTRAMAERAAMQAAQNFYQATRKKVSLPVHRAYQFYTESGGSKGFKEFKRSL